MCKYILRNRYAYMVADIFPCTLRTLDNQINHRLLNIIIFNLCASSFQTENNNYFSWTPYVRFFLNNLNWWIFNARKKNWCFDKLIRILCLLKTVAPCSLFTADYPPVRFFTPVENRTLVSLCLRPYDSGAV